MKRSQYIVSKVRANTARVARSIGVKEMYNGKGNARKVIADRIRQMRKGKKC